MNYIEIEEISNRIKRISDRVKNSGDIPLAQLGLQKARKAKRQYSEKAAKAIEQEYLWILKEKYLPNLPKDKIVPTIKSMAGYDDTSVASPNSTVDKTMNVETPKNDSHSHTGIHNSEPPQEGTYITAAADMSHHIVLSKHINDHFTPKAGAHIIVTHDLENKIRSIADDYHNITGSSIVINDAFRTPHDQAAIMFKNIEDGRMPVNANKTALSEVMNAYHQGKNNGFERTEIIKNMTTVIQHQTEQGIFISKHMLNNGFDVRSQGMTQEQKEQFVKSVKNNGGKVIKESDHFHVQF